mgnify:CR=1 FL=1
MIEDILATMISVGFVAVSQKIKTELKSYARRQRG